MKIWKKIIGIALTLVLVLQCGQGIVISKADSAPVDFSSIPKYSELPTQLTVDKVEMTYVANQGKVFTFTLSNLTSNDIGFKAYFKYDLWGTQTGIFSGSVAAGAKEAKYTYCCPNTTWDGAPVTPISIDVKFTSAKYYTVPGLAIDENNPPVIKETSSGQVEIDPKAEGVGSNDVLKYDVKYINGAGTEATKSFYVSGINGRYYMSDSSWYNDNILVKEWTITGLIKCSTSSDYSWMSVSVDAASNTWKVTNTSDNKVTGYTMRINGVDTPFTDSLEQNQTSSPRNFSFGSNAVAEIALIKADYVSPVVGHASLSSPSEETSWNGNTYTTWSLVEYGVYVTGADGSKSPIQWRVLEIKGDELVLMANKALFSMPYEGKMFDAEWSTSSLRDYLNNDFIDDAFGGDTKKELIPVTLDNSATSGTKAKNGAATTDKVYLLSVAELNNPNYHLYGGDASNSVIETRQFEATEATLANKNLTKKEYNGKTYVNYFLRSPGYYQYDVAGVSPSGVLNASGWRTYTKTAAVCPVIQVNKSKVNWVGSISKLTPSGFNTAAAKSVKVTPTKKLKALSIGDTKTVNNVTYEVTKTTNKSKTVAVAGVKKSAKKVVIPSTVKMNGATYKVTKIKANAFKKAKSNLKSITIKSKNITTMNKKAFDGLTKKTTVKISKRQYKKYKKLIKNDKLTVKKY